MTDIKIQHILTLSYLLSQGAKYNFVPVTTSALGQNIKKSQQAASQHLVELEQGGFIERILNGRISSVKITSKGYAEMVKLSTVLNSSLKSSLSHIDLRGSIVSGMGEGAYYMSLKGYTKQFKNKIGYVPFPGTLNVRIDSKENIESVRQFDALDGVLVNGFSDGKRTYGWVRCFAGTLNKSVNCQLIRLERTHHEPSVIELISDVNIRQHAKLSDGSKVIIKIPIYAK